VLFACKWKRIRLNRAILDTSHKITFAPLEVGGVLVAFYNKRGNAETFYGLEPVSLLCEHPLRRRAASLPLRKHLGAEAFAGLHHRHGLLDRDHDELRQGAAIETP
jgi:hypothetical protein